MMTSDPRKNPQKANREENHSAWDVIGPAQPHRIPQDTQQMIPCQPEEEEKKNRVGANGLGLLGP